MGLIYRDDLLNDEAFKEEFNAATGMELAIPDSVEGYVELAKAITDWKGEELYGAAMTAQQVDPIVMEFCNFLYSAGGDYYNADLTAPTINDETGVKAAELYIDCVNNAAQPGAASANYDDSIAVYSQGRAFSSVSFMWMLAVVDGDEKLWREEQGGCHAGWHRAQRRLGLGHSDQLAESGRGLGVRALGRVAGCCPAAALAGSLPTQMAPYEDEEILAKYPGCRKRVR